MRGSGSLARPKERCAHLRLPGERVTVEFVDTTQHPLPSADLVAMLDLSFGETGHESLLSGKDPELVEANLSERLVGGG